MQVHRRRSRLVRLSPTRPCASVDHATTWQGQCTRDFDCAKWFDASAGRTHTCICQCLVFVDWKNYPQVKLKCFSSQTPIQSLDSCICHTFFFRYDFGAAIAACLHVTPFNPTNIHARKDPDRHCSCYLVGEVFMMSLVASDAEFADTAIITFVSCSCNIETNSAKQIQTASFIRKFPCEINSSDRRSRFADPALYLMS